MPGNFKAEREAIAGTFRDEWEDGVYGTVPLGVSNVKFEPPIVPEPYLYLNILPGSGTVIGYDLVRFVGVVQIDVVVPKNDGTDEAREIADTARKIFERRQLITDVGDVITFFSADLGPQLTQDDTYRLALSFDYQRDEIGVPPP